MYNLYLLYILELVSIKFIWAVMLVSFNL